MLVNKDHRIAIIGASGFIGKNLVEFLLRKINNINIIGIDLLPSKFNCSRYNHFQFDICDETKFSEVLLLFRPQWIIHLAAIADLKTCDISELSVNWVPIKTLKSVQNSLDNCNLVYFSSMLANESNISTPDKVYGHSKFIMEQECCDTDNENFIILRPSTVWGIYHENWINDFVRACKYRYIFKIKNINPVRYFCYVENVSSYIHNLIMFGIKDEHKSKVFFLTDPPVKIHDFINTFTRIVFGYNSLCISFNIMYIIAKIGDILSNLKFKFPLTTFRLHNLSTDMFLNKSQVVMCKSQYRLNLECSCHDFKIKSDSV